MQTVIRINNLDETIELGKQLGELLKPNMLITLSGDLGAGKTTFTKGIGLGLEIKKIINSPTFTILKQYQGRLNLSHFDAYRLEGQDENFDSDDVCVVEWANYIEDILPTERLEIEIKKIDENARDFIFRAVGSRYEQLLEEFK